MFGSRPSAGGTGTAAGAWPRLYALALVAAGLALLALAPLSHTLFSTDQLEQQAVAAVAARRLLDPVLGLAWLLGAFLVVGGLYWLIRSFRWAGLLSILLAAGLTAGAVAGATRLATAAAALRPSLAVELTAGENQLPQLRGRLYAYAQREGLGFVDQGAMMARRQQRPDALWIELKKGPDTVAVASDMLHPGRPSIQFYDPPGEPPSGVWKERLTTDLAATWPDVRVLTP